MQKFIFNDRLFLLVRIIILEIFIIFTSNLTNSITLQKKMKEGKTNRLIHEKSPYLLQHAYNPVDWYSWGEEAFRKSREEDKPIFLSIGYSTCYWCHVMEREDFENHEIADIMNKNFVCIKVDREERPDVDRIYMTAVQAITGSGGWPMSVFLTPDLKPFFGGTYFPPKPSVGRPSFPQILEHITNLWKSDRPKILESSKQIMDFLNKHAYSDNTAKVSSDLLDSAYHQFVQNYDMQFGGFGSGTKFPQPVTFNFLLHYHARTKDQFALQMTLTTLRKMAEGGVYDHIGGGFHRYSVDEQWRVPHFEKMLYDQAQLTSSYLDAYQITHNEFFASAARDIFSYVLRNMTHRDGAFYSAEDAESALDLNRPNEKEEGTFYVWTKFDVENILGSTDAAIFNYHYGVHDSGNALRDPMHVFVGKNILYTAHSLEETAKQFNKPQQEIQIVLTEARKKLFAEREKRPNPHLDDKIITAWNGLMISAFAKAFQILGEHQYLETSKQAAEFIISKLYDPKTHKLLRRYRDGEARFNGTLQDYAFLTQGLLDLYEASFDIKWLERAIDLTKKQNELFWDPTNGGFFDTEQGDTSLLIRTKEYYDGAEPAGNSVAALNLLRLSQMTDNKEWRTMAEKTIAAFGSRLQQLPNAMAQMLVALDWMYSTPKEIIIAGNPNSNDTKELLKEVHSHFIPNKIILLADGADGEKKLSSYLSFVEGMKMLNGKATAYICENYTCQLPTSERTVVAQLLNKNTK